MDLTPSGSKRRVAFWNVVPAAQHLGRGARRSCLLSLSSADGLSVCALPFSRLKLEETREVQNLRKRPNGVRWVSLGDPKEEEAELTETRPLLDLPHNYLLRQSFFS